MKTKLTFLLSLTFLFLFSGSVYGQEEVKKEYWGNGKLQSETHYKNGKKEGLMTTWYETGEKKYETHYKNRKREGLATWWYRNGNKETERHFKNGIENGVRKEWDEDGTLTGEGYYIDGVKEKTILHTILYYRFIFIYFFPIFLPFYIVSVLFLYIFFIFIQYVSTNISRRLDFCDMTDEQIAEVKQEVEKNRSVSWGCFEKNQFNWWVNLSSFWKVTILLLVGLLFNIYWWVFVFEVPPQS